MEWENLLCIFLLLLLSNSCTDFEEDGIRLRGMLQEAGGQNEAARQLFYLMEKQDGTYQMFQNELAKNKPLFDETSTGASTDFGPYFIVPYMNNDTITGCVVYPLNINENKNVWSKDALLGVPKNLDVRYQNNIIPVERQYLYSKRFKTLREEGYDVSLGLASFADTLTHRNIRIETGLSLKNLYQGTRSFPADYSVANVILNYDIGSSLFYDDEDVSNEVVVYGLSAKGLMSIVEEEFNKSPFYSTTNVSHPSFHCISLQMNFYDKVYSNIGPLIEEAVNRVIMRVNAMRFYMTTQYTYQFVQMANNSTGEPHIPETGGCGASQGDNSKKDVVPVKIAEDCNLTKTTVYYDKVSELLNVLRKIDGNLSSATTSYEAFLDKVSSCDVEYSTMICNYEGSYGLNIPIKGDSFKVMNNFVPSAIYEIHNHINQTPPSFRDVLFTAKNAYSEGSPNFRATFVLHPQDETFYCLYVYDKDKAHKFYEKYKNDLDEATNTFQNGSTLLRFLEAYNINNISTAYLYQIVSILSLADSGISLSRITNDEIISYDIHEESFVDKNKEKKQVTIVYCKNAR